MSCNLIDCQCVNCYIERETQKYRAEIDKAIRDLIVYGNAGVQIITNENGGVIVKNIDLNSEEAMQELADEAQRLELGYTDETYAMQLKGESEE